MAIPDLIVSGSAPLDERMDVLERWLESLTSGGDFNGSVLIARGGQIQFEKHCGFADLDARTPLTERSSFSLCSVSKPFTAMAIMMLAHRQKLRLDDKLAQYIPELPPYGGITIRHLLNHTSGMADYMQLAEETWDPRVTLTMADMIGLFIKYRPRPYFQPGEQFEYSNAGYVFLAEIVVRVSGRSYPDFMADEIFRPLGMRDSAAFNRTSGPCPLPSRVIGFRRHNNGVMRCDLNFLDGVFGDGGIYSSARDLVLWDRALREGTLLPVDVYAEAYRPGRLRNGDPIDYGFGWEIEPGNVVEHWGEWDGFASYLRRDLGRHTMLAVLSNFGPATEVDPVCSEIGAMLEGIA